MRARVHLGACPAPLAKGDFRTLRLWLTEHLYQYGATLAPTEALRRATGKDISIEPYLDHLWANYKPLYDLDDGQSELSCTPKR
jgi:carboxypeptidase Taq